MKDRIKGYASEMCKVLCGKYAQDIKSLKQISPQANFRNGDI